MQIPQIPIVYEARDFLVVIKPSGLITHPKNKYDKQYSLAAWLKEKYPEVKDLGADPLRNGIVHRLDKETSGLIILAKTLVGYDYFKKQFKEQKIHKTYLALVHGHLKQKNGIIDTPVAKMGVLRTTRLLGKKLLKGQEAITEYRVLEEYRDYSLVQAVPKTGRTHQIRLHLKFLGHTVVCDRFYRTKNETCPPELNRLFLHAQKLSFTSPTGEALALEADLPPELHKFLEVLPKKEN